MILRTLVMIALLVCAGVGCVDRNSPEYAAEQILSALRDRDHLRLGAFVDQDRLAQDLVDQANQQAITRARESAAFSERGIYLGMSLGRVGQVEMMRSAIHEAFVRFTDPKRERTSAERSVIGRIRIGRVRQADHAAEVEVQLPSSDTSDSVRLTARLEWSGNAWRLVGLNGTAALMGVVESAALADVQSGLQPRSALQRVR